MRVWEKLNYLFSIVYIVIDIISVYKGIHPENDTLATLKYSHMALMLLCILIGKCVEDLRYI